MKFSVYNLDTGFLTGRLLTAPTQEAATKSTPLGCGVVDGHYSELCYKVVDGLITYFEPIPPGDGYVWDLNISKWRRSENESLKDRAKAKALEDIELLEKQQLRPLRELVINPNSGDAKKRVSEIEGQIDTLRGLLAGTD